MSCEKLQGERTSSNIYHLLTGRRSIQTTLDSYLFQLQHYYGVYKSLKKDDFDHYIKKLIEKGFLYEKVELLQVTNYARNWLNTNKHLQSESLFRGHLYHSMQLTFYARFLLITQVWTNFKMKNHTYIPVIEDKLVEHWVKWYYVKTKSSIDEKLHDFYLELNSILQTVSNRQASIFVDRITGYKSYGLSIDQLAKKYSMSKHDIYLHLISVIHQLINKSQKNVKKYPLLNDLFSDLIVKQSLSKSSQQTNQLLQSGLSAEQIAQKRQLSINTIYDHIVEIALHNSHFPYEQYVTTEETKLVLQIVKRLKTFRLKEIKKYVPDEMTYFQIRLILTQLNKER